MPETPVSIPFRSDIESAHVSLSGAFFADYQCRGIRISTAVRWADGLTTVKVWDEFPGLNATDSYGGLHPDAETYRNSMERAADWLRELSPPETFDQRF